MRAVVLSILTLALLSVLLSCTDYPCELDATLELAQVENDFNELRDLIVRNHPLNFASRRTVEQAFALQHAKLRDSMTVAEFYRALLPAVAAVRCSHIRLFLPGCVREDLYNNGRAVPLVVKVVHDTLIVLGGVSPEQDPPDGSIILSINSLPASEIIEIIKASLRADGENETHKYYLMNQHFFRSYMFALGESEEYRVQFVDPQGNQKATITLAAATPKEIGALSSKFLIQEYGKDVVSTEVDSSGAHAILRIRFFDYYDDISEFTGLIDDFFSGLRERRIESLIIDLRGNDGGSPYSAAYLLGYLIGKPFNYFAVHSTFLHDDLKDLQQVPANPYEGELYVLVDGGCCSTTGHFLSLLRGHGKGILVGEETGGSYVCNGGFREHSLHNTGIELLLPHATFVAAVQGFDTGRGIVPDLPVGLSVDDILNGNDRMLKAALALMRTTQ